MVGYLLVKQNVLLTKLYYIKKGCSGIILSLYHQAGYQMQTLQTEQNNTDSRSSKGFSLLLLFIAMIVGLIIIYIFVLKNVTDVVAKGIVISKNYNKILRYPSGGFITHLNVHQGDTVYKNEPLVVIDHKKETQKLQSAVYEYDEYLFKKARLTAKARNSATLAKIDNPLEPISGLRLLKNQSQKILTSQADILKIKIKLLNENNHLLMTQNDGLRHLMASIKTELSVTTKELRKYKALYKKRMINEIVLFNLQRKIQLLQGTLALKTSALHVNDKKIKININKIKYAKLAYMNDADKQLKTVDIKLAQLRSRIRILKHMISLSILKAPQSGIIMDMQVHSAGEVVTPFKPVLTIATKQFVTIEAFIYPKDITKVHLDQPVSVLFPTFAVHSHVAIEGKISYISPDVVKREGSDENYYKIIVTITNRGMKTIKSNNFKILPGLQSATVYISEDKKHSFAQLLKDL